jgi:quercetin dioxygenase-like cupin family protein
MLLEQIKQIDRRLSSINDLLLIGDMVRVAPDTIAQVAGAIFSTVVDEPGYQMGVATFAKKGDGTEEHSHRGITQFLIQAKGRTAAFFGDGGYRVLDIGECCIIKPGEPHKFVALTDDSVQLWICIPAEPGYQIDFPKGE